MRSTTRAGWRGMFISSMASGISFSQAVESPEGRRRLLVDFTSTDQTALLDGTVWARPAGGGLWLELPGAGRSLEKLEGVLLRGEPRWGSEQLVLAEGEDRSAILCRTHDV